VALVALLGLGITASPAKAAALPIGGFTPGVVVAPLVGPIIGGPTVYPFAGGSFSGTFTVTAVMEAGGIGFSYVVTNAAASADFIHRVTMTCFTDLGSAAFGAMVLDVGYVDTGGTIPPVTVDRSSTNGGDTIGFNFTPPPTAGIPAGGTSETLIIRTNATSLTPGLFSAINSTTDTITVAEAPTCAIPAPPAIVLALAGLPFLGLSYLRRRLKKA
jgi:hypothetical protein